MGTINDKLNKLEQTKTNLRNELNSKGAEVEVNDTFASYVGKVHDLLDLDTEMSDQTALITQLENTVQGKAGKRPNWSEIGYTDTPQEILDGFDYAKQIKDNWNSSITTMNQKYQNNINLRYFPIVDTSNVTNFTRCFDSSRLKFLPALNMSAGIYFYRLCMGCTSLEYVLNINTENAQNFQEAFQGCSKLTQFPIINTSKATNVHSMFNRCSSLVNAPAIDTSNVIDAGYFYFGCTKLENVPIYNFKKITNVNNAMYVMFQDCPALTNESLNNILASLLTATEYAGTKTLKYIGLKQTQAETCQTLSNWADCVEEGWTTGY